MGKQYIEAQLKQTRDYIDVFDLIQMGQQKEENGEITGALKAYREARDKAASLYFSAGKEEAMAKQAALEEKIDKDNQKAAAAQAAAKEESKAAKEAEDESAKAEEEKAKKEEDEKRELENQQKLNDQKNAIDLENKGNELMAGGKYESAITYYQTAQAIYIRLELTDIADGLNQKIAAAKAGIKAKEEELASLEKESKAEEETSGDTGPGVNSKKTDKK